MKSHKRREKGHIWSACETGDERKILGPNGDENTRLADDWKDVTCRDCLRLKSVHLFRTDKAYERWAVLHGKKSA